MEIPLSILPVLFFLLFLFFLDSFKLVVKRILLVAILWGVISAGIAYLLNNLILYTSDLSFENFSRFIAPGTEEVLKSLFVFYLVSRKKAGFLIDAAIYGFAIGAGFALVENSLYAHTVADAGLLVWIIRGFGTALMHGGCTALIALILVGAKSRNASFPLYTSIAFVSAYLIHGAFNHFYINPLLQTVGIIILLPVIFILIFRYNEHQLQSWLEIEFSSEVELLQMIHKGKLSDTRAGEYLASLKTRFNAETIFDMYCYIQLYLELSIKAKRNLMLKESGFPPITETDIQEKLLELAALRKEIGRTGEITLSPLISMNYRDLWKFNLLKND
ncbi:MAG: PrsW family glutamic-type intramembrane protease [bacterium]|nr:PrsW family glutamic-type intramembrane protease [bacterium]MDD3968812.1 PrsW family glutamic-type intramembrane protease [Proteiniphilum sp.]MDD4459892.1 PrsW family glutamic-type intramembrane protease [Proteiniphilum sp.]